MLEANRKSISAPRLIGDVGVCLITLTLTGCAVVDPRPDYEAVASHVTNATGIDALYRPEDERVSAERIASLLLDGLTVREAVEVSLLNNPRLQARFFDVGIARSDVVQAGLLSNPSLSMALRFPTDGGSSIFEASLVENIATLWQLSPRKRAANERLEEAILSLARDASVLAFTTKAAYFRAVASKRRYETASENRDIAQRLLDVALARQQAGAGGEVDVVLARSELLEVELSSRQVSLEVFEAAKDLAALLGLATPPTELGLTDSLPEASAASFSIEDALRAAEANRLDLKAAQHAKEAAKASYDQERKRVFPLLEVGADLEDDSGLTLGPAVGLELPLFDQNQARIAAAQFAYLQTDKLLRALTTDITQEVRGKFQRWTTALDVTRFYRDELLPVRTNSLELAREAYRAGQTSFLALLEAERRLLQARGSYVDALRDASLAAADLEATTGLSFERLLIRREEERALDEKRSGNPRKPRRRAHGKNTTR